MLQNARVTTFTVSELLRENQQRVKLRKTDALDKIEERACYITLT